MKHKREPIVLEFRCFRCGKLQPKDEKQSNSNWSVYPANAKCECGGEFRMYIPDAKSEESR